MAVLFVQLLGGHGNSSAGETVLTASMLASKSVPFDLPNAFEDLLLSLQQPYYVSSRSRVVAHFKSPLKALLQPRFASPRIQCGSLKGSDPGQRFPTDDRHTYFKRAFDEVGYPVQQSRTYDLGNREIAQDQCKTGVSSLLTQMGP